MGQHLGIGFDADDAFDIEAHGLDAVAILLLDIAPGKADAPGVLVEGDRQHILVAPEEHNLARSDNVTGFDPIHLEGALAEVGNAFGGTVALEIAQYRGDFFLDFFLVDLVQADFVIEPGFDDEAVEAHFVLAGARQLKLGIETGRQVAAAQNQQGDKEEGGTRPFQKALHGIHTTMVTL